MAALPGFLAGLSQQYWDCIRPQDSVSIVSRDETAPALWADAIRPYRINIASP
jgi:hypothetical protein